MRDALCCCLVSAGGLDLVFVTYYSAELALKIFAYPRDFWLSRYNQV
jgi:hypothetical protein